MGGGGRQGGSWVGARSPPYRHRPPPSSPPHPPTTHPGCAGTGKSLLLRHILAALPGETTYVTGTTGLAACHLGGTTINAFAGVGRGEGGLEGMLRAASRGEAALRWRRATALVVDEVSAGVGVGGWGGKEAGRKGGGEERRRGGVGGWAGAWGRQAGTGQPPCSLPLPPDMHTPKPPSPPVHLVPGVHDGWAAV